MAVSSGLYGLTLEKMMLDTCGESLEEASNVFVAMVTDTHTPAFDTDDFFADIDNEVSGTGYTSGGMALPATLAVTLAAGTLTYDGGDCVWTTATISSAEAAVGTTVVGSAATDQLIWMSDFGGPYSSTAGDFTITWHANGIFTIDYTP